MNPSLESVYLWSDKTSFVVAMDKRLEKGFHSKTGTGMESANSNLLLKAIDFLKSGAMGEGDEAESEEQKRNVLEFCAGMTLWMQRERWFERRKLSFMTAIGGKCVFYFINKIPILIY